MLLAGLRYIQVDADVRHPHAPESLPLPCFVQKLTGSHEASWMEERSTYGLNLRLTLNPKRVGPALSSASCCCHFNLCVRSAAQDVVAMAAAVTESRAQSNVMQVSKQALFLQRAGDAGPCVLVFGVFAAARASTFAQSGHAFQPSRSISMECLAPLSKHRDVPKLFFVGNGSNAALDQLCRISQGGPISADRSNGVIDRSVCFVES